MSASPHALRPSKVLRIKDSADFQRMSREGVRFHASAFIMQVFKQAEGAPFRLGLTASRKVGNAVKRNRAKRRLRALVRESSGLCPTACDVVLIAKTAAIDADYARMKADFIAGLRKTGVLAT